jgi:hypothetical protein
MGDRDQFPVGCFVRLSDKALEICPEEYRQPMVMRVCIVTDPRKEQAGFIALQILTGTRAYKSVLVKPDQILPARPCYGCINATPMNDRDTVRCYKHGDEVCPSTHTCDQWSRR